jgi:hypothetical protein
MPEKFTPTPADEYPVVKTLELEMPSGARVRVRKPSVFYLVEHGLVPAQVRKIIGRGSAKNAKPLTEEEVMVVLNFLVAASYVSPKVSTSRKAGSIYVHDIPDEDRQAVIAALDLEAAV